MTIDWGPVPRLSDQLRRLDPGKSWHRTLQAYGSPWQAGLRLAGKVGPAPLRWTEPKAGGWWNWPWSLFSPRPAQELPPPDVGMLPELLTRCHQWADQRVLDFLFPWSWPLAHLLGEELTSVTPRGVWWCLLFHQLDRGGAGDFQAVSEALDGAEPPATLADAILVHWLLENFVSGAAPVPGPGFSEPPPERRRGGLRQPATLRFHAAHPPAPDPRRIAWDRLVRFSPLTQLVYFDLLAETHPPDGRVFEPAPTELASPQGWFQLWLAHLGRSLAAAVASPPSAFEDWLRSVRQVEETETWKPPWWTWPSLAKARRQALLQAARSAEREARQRLAGEMAGRPLRLGRLLSAHDPFKRRFWDMLIRQSVAEAAPEMEDQWRVKQAANFRVEPREAFFSDDGCCYRSYLANVFGRDAWNLAMEPLDQSQREAFEEGLKSWLPDETEAAHPDSLDSPVQVPFGFRDCAAPGQLLAEWVTNLLNDVAIQTPAEDQ